MALPGPEVYSALPSEGHAEHVLDDHISETQDPQQPLLATLLYIQDFIDQVIALQRSWMALEPIFASKSEPLARIDSNFRMRMEQVKERRSSGYAGRIASPEARSRTSFRK